MKFRFGHVSNSSSTSFLLYGLDFDMSREEHEQAILDAARVIGLDLTRYEDNPGKPEDGYDFYDLMMSIARKLDVVCEYGWEMEHLYLGIYPTKIKDDETGAEFKERVKGLLSIAFGDDLACKYHEKAFYEG
jgi:hypothetical protein